VLAHVHRLPGRVSVVRKLREAFDTGGSRPSLDDVDVHSVASLLKLYLCDLPQPIIPVAHYDRVMHIVTRERPLNADTAITALSVAIRQLPVANYDLLKYLCSFLHDVAQRSDRNRMTASNLATVFSPCFIKPEIDDPALLAGTAINRTSAVEDMIKHFVHVFAAAGGDSDSAPSQDVHCSLNGTVSQMPPDIVIDAGHSVDEAAENTEEKGSIKRQLSDVNEENMEASESVDTAVDVRELQSTIVVLQQQLLAERCVVNELRQQLVAERKEVTQQAELLAKKLDEERTATSDAVMRVVELQTKLQQYSIKYGLLD